MDVNISQLMHCLLICYNNLTCFVIINQRTRLMKTLMSYFKSNCIIGLKKHVKVNRGLIAKKVEEEVNYNMKSPMKKQHSKERPTISKNAISNFFGAIIKKIMCTTKTFSRI